MSPVAPRPMGLVLGGLSIAVGVFNWLWIFYAWDAAWHMGSPLRRHSKHVVASLTGDHAYVARDSHSTGLVLIDVLGNTFWVMFASGAFLVTVGLLLIYLSIRERRLQYTVSESPSHDPRGPSPLSGSA
ncbi:hypothetical protein [Pseudoxanthomonas sp. CF385]|uniref:hypothetical protein n=1 Tax=Pseudoxanthomonas sp. CF385 TaxID=1881042 RepID=UPI001113C3FF|nr:hypothetical protein [Pseudoxanthomonas sp. CF385]